MFVKHRCILDVSWVTGVPPSQTGRLAIPEEVNKLPYWRARSRGLNAAISVIMLSSFMIPAICGSVCDQTGANHAEVPSLVFTDGEDTSTFGGVISTDRIHVGFTGIWLAVESDIVITQLVNITNIGRSDCALEISVGAEDFGIELSSLKIYLVSPSWRETLVVELDDSGNVVTQNVPVSIPQKEEWTMKLAGHYDSGTSISQSNSLALHFQVAS